MQPFQYALVALLYRTGPAGSGEQVHVLALPSVGHEGDHTTVAVVRQGQARLLQRLAADALLGAFALLALAAHADPLVAVQIVLLLDAVEHQVFPLRVLNIAKCGVFHGSS